MLVRLVLGLQIIIKGKIINMGLLEVKLQKIQLIVLKLYGKLITLKVKVKALQE